MVYYDPGHVKKNLVKQLKKLCKTAKGYASLPERLGTHFMHLVKQAEKAHPDHKPVMRAWFLERWAHTMQHYCCGPCASGCTCPGVDKSGGAFYLNQSDKKGAWIIARIR